MDSLRRPIATLSDSFNLCQALKSDKGTGSDKRLRIVTAMLRQVFCVAQGATLACVTTATMLADALTKALVHCPSLLAAMNARRHVFVTSDSSYRCEDNLYCATVSSRTEELHHLLARRCATVISRTEELHHLLARRCATVISRTEELHQLLARRCATVSSRTEELHHLLARRCATVSSRTEELHHLLARRCATVISRTEELHQLLARRCATDQSHRGVASLLARRCATVRVAQRSCIICWRGVARL